jgi:crotonobetainyl-CoA:carnitine CoA-transferase CaiB-like acyl-CoA transferase
MTDAKTSTKPMQATLAGLRILELGHFIAAPFCTRLLADLGADVIKIEPRTGDPVRQWGEMIDGHSLWWSISGRNKKSVTLDLKSPKGREIALRIAAECDVVVENFRPGQLAKMGLGPNILRRTRPDLIVAHISGYGQNGPYRDRAAFGLIGEAIGGLRYLTDHPPGTTDLPPVRVGVSIGDSVAGLYAAFGIVAALWQRDGKRGDGAGRTVDVALTESVFSLMEGMMPEFGALGKVKQPMGGALPTAAPTNAYPTLDEGWILIGANSDSLFAKLAAVIGRSDLINLPKYKGNKARVRNAASLDSLISEWTCRHDTKTLLDILNRADIPNCKVYTAADCAADPQYLAREMVREVDDPIFGMPILHSGVVPHIPESPGLIRWPGPSIGQHNEEILSGMLGLTSEEITDLHTERVI